MDSIIHVFNTESIIKYGVPGIPNPYSPEEQRCIGLLIGILRGENKKNARAIKENIEAFHFSKDLPIGVISKAADYPAAELKKTADDGK